MIIHLSKPTEYRTPRINPNVNCGLWVIMCQCRLSCDECTTLVGKVDNGGGYACVGVQVVVDENSLHLPLHFAVNLKLL